MPAQLFHSIPHIYQGNNIKNCASQIKRVRKKNTTPHSSSRIHCCWIVSRRVERCWWNMLCWMVSRRVKHDAVELCCALKQICSRGTLLLVDSNMQMWNSDSRQVKYAAVELQSSKGACSSSTRITRAVGQVGQLAKLKSPPLNKTQHGINDCYMKEVFIWKMRREGLANQLFRKERNPSITLKSLTLGTRRGAPHPLLRATKARDMELWEISEIKDFSLSTSQNIIILSSHSQLVKICMKSMNIGTEDPNPPVIIRTWILLDIATNNQQHTQPILQIKKEMNFK